MSEACVYNIPELPEGVVLLSAENRDNKEILKWSGDYPIPEIGDHVKINFNDLGTGAVVSYFVEHGYLGLTVKLFHEPDWHIRQTRGTHYEGKALVFGNEIKRLEKP